MGCIGVFSGVNNLLMNQSDRPKTQPPLRWSTKHARTWKLAWSRMRFDSYTMSAIVKNEARPMDVLWADEKHGSTGLSSNAQHDDE